MSVNKAVKKNKDFLDPVIRTSVQVKDGILLLIKQNKKKKEPC